MFGSLVCCNYLFSIQSRMGNPITSVHNLKNSDFLSLTAEIAVLNTVLLHCEDVWKVTYMIYKIPNMGLRFLL